MELWERVELVMKTRGWTAYAWAQRADLSEATITNMVSRKAKGARPKTLMSMATSAGVSFAWLAGGEGPSGLENEPPAAAPPPELRVERDEGHVPEDDEVPLETALFAVFAEDRRGAKRYTTADFDAARAAIRATHRKTHPFADLDAHATRLLDAARQLRAEGIPTDAANLMARAAVGKTERAAEVVREVSDAYNAEADEELRAAGGEPGAGADEVRAAIAARKARKEKRGG